MTSPGLQLLLLVGEVVPRPAPAELVDALYGARITSATGTTGGFQLTFTLAPYSRPADAVLPGGLLHPKQRIVVVVVLAGRCHVLMDGVITHQETHAGRTPGSSYLVVTGEDLSTLMDLRHVRRAYPGMAPHLRATAVCAGYAQYGVTPRAVAPVLTDQPDPVLDVPVQSATDLAYLRAMAEDVGHVFHLVPGPAPGVSTAYWGPQYRGGAPQPALTAGCGPAGNVEELAFTFDSLATAGYTTHRLGPSATTSEVTAPGTRLLRDSLAAHPAPALRTGPLPGHTARSLTQTLLAGLGRQVAVHAVTGRGTVDVLRYGHVLSAHGGPVGVRGAGRAHDGRYLVAAVTHELSRHSYRQHFTLVRDGLGADRQVVTV